MGQLNNPDKQAGRLVAPSAGELVVIVEHYRAGRIDEALAAARILTRRFPQHAFGWTVVGTLLREQGRIGEALEPLRIAESLSGDAESKNNLGLILQESGDFVEAEHAFQAALRLKPNLVVTHANLGRLYHITGRLAEAKISLASALRLDSGLAEAHNALGAVLLDCGELTEAEASCRRAIACRADYVEAHACLGAVLAEMDRLSEAEASCRQALRLSPGFPSAYSNLGRIYQSLGRLSEAEASYRRALQFQPEFLKAHSNLLFSHCYQAHLSPRACLEEARQYGQKVSARVGEPYSSWALAAEPPQLRVGLVSGDLRQHPVGHFLNGVLAQLDRSQLEVFAYPTYHHSDPLTKRIRSHCAGWTPLYGHGDAGAARLIHADGIHVLIDLAGHTAHNRLPVFAHRPAPVQVTWLGYFATTGVAEIDYLLADPVSVPPEHQGHFSETIWYLPDTRLCFTPPQDAPAVTPLPALANGSLTFGSFQKLAKINEEVLALWGRVLAALPSARLRLQNKQLADAAVRLQLGQRLQAVGIAADRVSMHGSAPRADYLAAHAEVDLILDTFPFPGGTTTCEALYMGVPTLTLAGDRLIGRQGASLLAAAGLRAWIAEAPAEYVDKALALASDLQALAALRASLRAQVLASPLFDAPLFARNVEDALWAMWRRFSDRRTG